MQKTSEEFKVILYIVLLHKLKIIKLFGIIMIINLQVSIHKSY